MGMRKIGAPAENSVHNTVVSNLDDKENLKKESDTKKDKKNED